MKDRTKTARVTTDGGAKRNNKRTKKRIGAGTNKKSHGLPWLS
jgi:hypothetical protein